MRVTFRDSAGGDANKSPGVLQGWYILGTAIPHSGTQPAGSECVGPLTYTGHAILQRDLENLKIALQGKNPDALKLLDGEAGTYAVLFDELRGDIKFAEGDRAAALAAYSKALASLGAATAGTPNAPIAESLQHKIDDLADVAAVKS